MFKTFEIVNHSFSLFLRKSTPQLEYFVFQYNKKTGGTCYFYYIVFLNKVLYWREAFSVIGSYAMLLDSLDMLLGSITHVVLESINWKSL
jgi:hypothetical protein